MNWGRGAGAGERRRGGPTLETTHGAAQKGNYMNRVVGGYKCVTNNKKQGVQLSHSSPALIVTLLARALVLSATGEDKTNTEEAFMLSNRGSELPTQPSTGT